MSDLLDETGDLELARPAGTQSGAPLYRQLAAKLRAEIESGSRGPNELLPSERDIAVHYAMSRDTVRKAVRLLEDMLTSGTLYQAPIHMYVEHVTPNQKLPQRNDPRDPWLIISPVSRPFLPRYSSI